MAVKTIVFIQILLFYVETLCLLLCHFGTIIYLGEFFLQDKKDDIQKLVQKCRRSVQTSAPCFKNKDLGQNIFIK